MLLSPFKITVIDFTVFFFFEHFLNTFVLYDFF